MADHESRGGTWRRWYVVINDHDQSMVTGELGPFASRREATKAALSSQEQHTRIEYRHRAPGALTRF
jgi:hypothetical protein